MFQQIFVLCVLFGAVHGICLDPNEKELSGICFQYVKQKKTFEDARDWCHYKNPVTQSNLAYIPTQLAANFLASYAQSAFGTKDGAFWIGLSRAHNFNQWQWDTGVFLDGWSNFDAQHNKNFAAEQVSNGKWITFDDTEKHYFVCSYDPKYPVTFATSTPSKPTTTTTTTTGKPTTTEQSIAEAPEGIIVDGVVIDPTRRLSRKLSVSHVFITSAYYYPTSKSLGENAIALNMVVDSINFNVENATYNVVGTNGTHKEFTVATSKVEGVPLCRYATAMASTNTVSNLKKLEMESNGVKVEIPFKMARYTAPKPVIICISPQFVAEQWQMFLMHVHVANRFGGHLHMYVTSMIESYFELMREYERQGYLTLDYWLRMKFEHAETPYFEPNGNIEWRNQAGAETDCLLQYKEAAEYIAFFDMDDILFPANYPTYLEEFNAEWAILPNATSMFYGRREHEFIKAQTMSEFSFTELVANLRSSPTVKRGKVVVRGETYNHTWIHHSWHEDPKRRHNVSFPHLVHVQRPLQKNGQNNITHVWKMKFGPLNETIRAEDIRVIEEDYWRIRDIPRVAELAKRLPSEDFYLPIVFKCYYDSFYGFVFDKVRQKGPLQCPNADLCELPQRENYRCIHSDAEYYSGPHMEPFTYHFSTNSFWSKDIGCYQ